MASSRRRFLLGAAATPAALVLTKLTPPPVEDSPQQFTPQDNSGISGFGRLMELHAKGLISDQAVNEIMGTRPTRLSFSGRAIFMHYD